MGKLVPFTTPLELESFLVQAAKDRLVPLRLDHRDQSVVFNPEVFASAAPDAVEGPSVSSLHSTMVRQQLTTLSQRLTTVVAMLDPAARAEARKVRREGILKDLAARAATEHTKLLRRAGDIDKREHYVSVAAQLKQQELADAADRQLRDMREREAKATKEVLERAAQEKRERELREIEREQQRQRVNELKNTAVGDRMIADKGEAALLEMTSDQLRDLKIQFIDRMNREHSDRVRATFRKVDYWERACRAEELPLLEAQALASQQAALEKRQAEEKAFEANKERFAVMAGDAHKLVERILATRRASVDAANTARQITLNEFDRLKAAAVAARKAAEAAQKVLKDIEDEERAREAEVRRLEDLERQRIAEERQREEAERLAKLEAEREAERQRRREEVEAEEKVRREAAEAERLARLQRLEQEAKQAPAPSAQQAQPLWRPQLQQPPAAAPQQRPMFAPAGGAAPPRGPLVPSASQVPLQPGSWRREQDPAPSSLPPRSIPGARASEPQSNSFMSRNNPSLSQVDGSSNLRPGHPAPNSAPAAQGGRFIPSNQPRNNNPRPGFPRSFGGGASEPRDNTNWRAP